MTVVFSIDSLGVFGHGPGSVWARCGNGLAGACSGSVGLRQVFGKEALAKTLPELCPKTTNESMPKTHQTVTNAQPETLAKHYQNITKN